jgi:hypothetical protein
MNQGFFLLFMLDHGSNGSESVQVMTDPDPEGPKTYDSDPQTLNKPKTIRQKYEKSRMKFKTADSQLKKIVMN